MNKRIEQLAIEAGYEKDMFGIGHWDMPEFQKFAELIVQECVKVAVQDDDDPDLSDNGAYTAGKVTASIMIQEHFGFEE